MLCHFAFSQEWKDSLSHARKLYKEGNYIESYNKYKSAQKKAPKNIDLSDEIGQSAYKAQEFEKAEKLFKQSSSSNGSKIQKAKTYHNIGNAKLKQKKYDEAIEAYKESLRNNPDDEETRYNLAEAMKKNKNSQKNQENNKENNKEKQKEQEKQNNNEKQENKQNKNPANKEENNSTNTQKSSLSDKKTERMLDDLAKKEMETKKKMGGNKSKSSTTKSGKDW